MAQWTNPSPDSGRNSPEQILLTTRIIWAALLLGQVMFLIVQIAAYWGRDRPRDEHLLTLLFYISVAMLIVVVPLGWFIRGFIYRAGRAREGTATVPPAAYVTGTIVFLALCEGASFMGLVGTMLNNGPWPHLIVPIIAMAIQILNFPTGAPMRGDTV